LNGMIASFSTTSFFCISATIHLKNADAFFFNEIAYFFYLYRFLGTFCIRKDITLKKSIFHEIFHFLLKHNARIVTHYLQQTYSNKWFGTHSTTPCWHDLQT